MSRRAVDWIAAVRILLFAGLLILGIFLPLPALEGVPLCFYYASSAGSVRRGMTRAFFHIMQGDVPGAFALNPVFTTCISRSCSFFSATTSTAFRAAYSESVKANPFWTESSRAVCMKTL